MKRRKLILGLSATVAASSATLGTGAFTSAQMDRAVDIRVSDDSRSLIGLIPNEDVAGVHEDANGRLTISVSDPGINVNSIYQFGHFTEGGPDVTPGWFTMETTENPVDNGGDDFKSAFLIANQASGPMNVTCSLAPTSSNADAGDTRFVFQFHGSDGKVTELTYPDQTVAPTMELGPGDALGVSFLVNALEGDIGDSFSASLRIGAGAPS